MERTNLPIKILAEYGEIATKGRHKGKPSPYGIGVLKISETEQKNKVPELIEEYCKRLLVNTSVLKECGVDEIIFDIESPRDIPSEISLSGDLVRNLSAINARVEFHTVKDSENIKYKINRLKDKQLKLDKEELYQKVLDNLQKHPSLYNMDISSFIIYYLTKNYSEKELDENLSKFEEFYGEPA